MKKLKIDSLDYELIFEGNKLKVGCQTIVKDDILKIKEFLNELEFESLPNEFCVYVGNKDMGRVLVKLLVDNGIQVHHRDNTCTESMMAFETYFLDEHKWYRITNGAITGSACRNKYKELSIKEVFNALN